MASRQLVGAINYSIKAVEIEIDAQGSLLEMRRSTGIILGTLCLS